MNHFPLRKIGQRSRSILIRPIDKSRAKGVGTVSKDGIHLEESIVCGGNEVGSGFSLTVDIVHTLQENAVARQGEGKSEAPARHAVPGSFRRFRVRAAGTKGLPGNEHLF
ncbi:MAG: hypothetical protein HPY84_15530 [Syntrophobacteraceae bacterium]|nr:hypothetical protein [Syntrophobacteraceae bacterium]